MDNLQLQIEAIFTITYFLTLGIFLVFIYICLLSMKKNYKTKVLVITVVGYLFTWFLLCFIYAVGINGGKLFVNTTDIISSYDIISLFVYWIPWSGISITGITILVAIYVKEKIIINF